MHPHSALGNAARPRYVDHANDSCNRVLDDLVPLVRPRQGALEDPRHRVRRRQHRDAAELPAEARRSHGRLHRPADRDRRAADRRLPASCARSTRAASSPSSSPPSIVPSASRGREHAGPIAQKRWQCGQYVVPALRDDGAAQGRAAALAGLAPAAVGARGAPVRSRSRRRACGSRGSTRPAPRSPASSAAITAACRRAMRVRESRPAGASGWILAAHSASSA